MIITKIGNDETKVLENQTILKSIFNTVDLIKSDLSQCTQFKSNQFSYSVKVSESTIIFNYDPKTNSIKRKKDSVSTKLMNNVTDFYLKFFPESKSLLYRIEVGKKEQIRGYIFLGNLIDN